MVVAGLRGQGAQQSSWAFFVQTLRGKAFQADCFVARLAKGVAIGTSPCFAHSILESRSRSPVEFFNRLPSRGEEFPDPGTCRQHLTDFWF